MIRSSQLALVSVLLASTASASPRRGVVESAHSRWSGDMIVTDVVVRTADGALTTITEHGGSVDGLGMIVSHRDATMRAGDEVTIDGRRLHRVTPVHSLAAPAEDGPGTIGVQRTSRSNKPLYHATGCVNFEFDGRGSARVDGEFAAFQAAFAAWETASANMACGGVRFTVNQVATAPDGHDGINSIHFRDDEWCRPASVGEDETCHSPQAVAVTRVLYVNQPFDPRDGEILEIDIDVNAIDFVLTTNGAAGAIDLQSAATHEIGHALGLDHNCGVEDGSWPLTRSGSRVPSCESAAPELVAATMYVQVQPGETTMRTPKASDLAGLCDVVGGTCELEVTGGCAVGGNGGGVIALAIAALSMRRRRRE